MNFPSLVDLQAGKGWDDVNRYIWTVARHRGPRCCECDLEDIVQTAHMRLLQNLDSIAPDNPKAYIWSIVNSCCVDYFRKNEKQPVAMPPDSLEGLGGMASAPKYELVDLVSQILRRFLPKDRDRLLDSKLYRLSGRELSKKYGESPNANYARVSRLCESFRQYYAEMQGE